MCEDDFDPGRAYAFMTLFNCYYCGGWPDRCEMCDPRSKEQQEFESDDNLPLPFCEVEE